MRDILRTLPVLAAAALALCGGRWAVAQTPGSPATTPPPRQNTAGTASGEVVLSSAIDAYARHPSVSANVRQQVHLFGQELFGSGVYMQQGFGPRRRFRLELTLQGRHQRPSLTRISDGRILWMLDDFATGRTLRLVDLRRVEDALALAEPTAPVWRASQVAFGGVPRLLATCQDQFEFPTAEPAQLAMRPVWMLRGHWNPEALEALLAEESSSGPALPNQVAAKTKSPPPKIPSHMPDEVVLYFDRATLFPCRIEYRGKLTDAEGKRTGHHGILTAMDFLDVRLGEPIDDATFARPADLPQIDHTDTFLQEIGVAIAPSDRSAKAGREKSAR